MKDQLFHHVWHALPWPALAALLHCFLLALGLRWYQALAGAVACWALCLPFAFGAVTALDIAAAAAVAVDAALPRRASLRLGRWGNAHNRRDVELATFRCHVHFRCA